MTKKQFVCVVLFSALSAQAAQALDFNVEQFDGTLEMNYVVDTATTKYSMPVTAGDGVNDAFQRDAEDWDDLIQGDGPGFLDDDLDDDND